MDATLKRRWASLSTRVRAWMKNRALHEDSIKESREPRELWPKRQSKRQDSYKYEPFVAHEIDRQIRLMTLFPGTFEAEIQVDVHTTSLTYDNIPQYEALSYAWGDRDDTVEIKIGRKGRSRLPVTQNLFDALKHLRYETEPRIFWIDAICVDQQNLEERGHQVERMRDIFTLANRVVVWLGMSADDSDLAFRLLRDLNSKIIVHEYSSTMRPSELGESEPHWADRDTPLKWTQQELWSMYHLLSRSWFERLWIWQEVYLADQNRTLIMCGRDELNWYEFRAAIFCVFRKDNPSGVDIHKKTTNAYSLSVNYPKPLHGFARRAAEAKCSDDRDRIYALLGMFWNPGKRLTITPDYTKSTRDVYMDAALSIIHQTNSSEFLADCELKDSHLQLPSWVPNLMNTRECESILHGGCLRAHGETPSDIKYLGDDIIGVSGVYHGNVVSTKFIRYLDENITALEIINELLPRENIDSEYPGGGPLIEAYMRTFCCENFEDAFVPPVPSITSYADSVKVIRGLIDDPESANLDNVVGLTYASRFRFYGQGRLFFFDDKGYVGVCPSCTLPDDQIWVVMGCPSPLILRTQENGRFKIVGECFVQGLMDGEIFLGRIPETHERVVMADDVSLRSLIVYRNRETEELSFQDPRIGPPADNWIMNRFTRESNTSADQWDSRLNAEALKARGVDLKSIEIE